MELKDLKLKNFDDMLYMISSYTKTHPSSIDLVTVDDYFLKQTLDVYNSLVEDKVVIYDEPSNNWFTASLYLIMFYNVLKNKDISMFATGAPENKFENMFKEFGKMTGLNMPAFQVSRRSGEVNIIQGNDYNVTVKFYSPKTFDIGQCLPITIFNNTNKMTNYEKYEDLLKNKDKHEWIVMNFPNNDNIAKLAKEFNIKRK